MVLHLLRDLMRTQGSSSDGQQVPSDGQAVGNTSPPDGPPNGPPPAGQTLAASTLSSLLQAQHQTPPSASDLAGQLISAADTDGDGSLSLDEITQALTGKGKSGDASSLASAFSSLDADGDGKLSSAELTTGLQDLPQARGHHHHHGHAYAYGRQNGQGQDGAGTAPTTPTTTAGDTPSVDQTA